MAATTTATNIIKASIGNNKTTGNLVREVDRTKNDKTISNNRNYEYIECDRIDGIERQR
jgi:hypothetical protein